MLALLEREEVDVVLLDMNFSAGINNGNEGLFWLQELKAHFSQSAGSAFYGLCRYRTGGGRVEARGGRLCGETLG